MADLYRYDWYDNTNDANYRMEIAPPSNTALSGTPLVGELNDDAVRDIKGFSWEFPEVFPFGLASPVRGEIVFKVDRAPTELVEWVVDNLQDVAPVINDDMSAPDQYTLECYAGVNVAIYKWDGASWVCRYVGVQDVSSNHSPDFGDRTLTVKIVDALQAAMKALPLETMRDADFTYFDTNHATDVVPRPGCYEYLYKDGSGWNYVAHATSGTDAVWGVKREALFDRWERHTNAVLKTLTRRSGTLSLTSALEQQRTGLRKQRYVKTEPYPSATTVPDADAYVLPFIADGTASGSSLLYSLHDEVARNYSSFYDFVVDMLTEGVRPAWFHYSANIAVTVSSADLFAGTATDITDEVRTASPQGNARILQVGTASGEFVANDDYDKIETVQNGGRAGENVTVPIVWSTSIRTGEYQSGSIAFLGVPLRAGQTDKLRTSWDYNIPMLSIYYLDNPNVSGNAFTLDSFIKCASWWNGDGSTAPSSATYSMEWSDPNGTAIADQAATGAMRQVASRLAVFAYNAAVGYPSEISYEIKQDAPTTGAESFAFNANLRPHTIDVPNMHPGEAWLANYPTEWYPTKCETNLKTGISKVEAYGF